VLQSGTDAMDKSGGLFRLWLCATPAWIIYTVGAQLFAETEIVGSKGLSVWPDGGTLDLSFWLWNVVFPPIAVFAFAYLVRWGLRSIGIPFAAWLAMTSLWIGVCLLRFAPGCFLGDATECDLLVPYDFLTSASIEAILITFGAPLAILLVGLSVVWVVNGFSPRKWQLPIRY
jgi:hypothetical protein